ncbi:MAG TPA: acyltransferase [Oscillatoriales cyanobacterium M59_W2019_021]|nr:acyltransferase [Oscillatoriales cyanobacterium M59_W2019_021]
MAELANFLSPPTRDLKLDYLKVIGLFCILLAHTEPGDFIDQIRNFDVPLMVMVSGVLFGYSVRNKPYDFKEYFQQRFWRLISPAWCFFIFFFGLVYLTSQIGNREFPYSWNEILETFTLLDGIGYVWVIRVFLIIALLSPALLKLNAWVFQRRRNVAIAIAVFLLYEMIATVCEVFDESDIYATLTVVPGTLFYLVYDLLLREFGFYAIAYSFVFLIGIRLPQLSQKHAIVSASCFGAIAFFLGIYYWIDEGKFIRTQDYKYPPQLYYLSYALFISILLYLLFDFLQKTKKLSNRNVNQFVVFVSSSSLWIYLWHILFLEYSNDNFLKLSLLSIAITYLQKQAIAQIIQRTPWGDKNANLLKVLFLK